MKIHFDFSKIKQEKIKCMFYELPKLEFKII